MLNLQKFRTLPDEIARRLLIGAISWISGSDYPPRRAPVLAALAALREGRAATLGGCHALLYRKAIWICREFSAVRKTCCKPGQIWDQRWRLTGTNFEGCEVRALGRNGVLQCPDWRDLALPQAALMASPALWRGDELLAAPLAGRPAGCAAELVDGEEGFFSSILTH